MTTDIAVVERALIIMAIAMSVQSLLIVGAVIAGFIAWRKASRAFEEARQALDTQVTYLRATVDRVSGSVEEVAGSVQRGTQAVGDVVLDVREAMGTLRHSVGSVAAVVTAPRAALALAVVRGIATWRRRRGANRLADLRAKN